MADDKIALEIFIEADKANLSLGELEQGFDAMKEQLKGVGRGSEEFKKLSSSMANTTAEIKNIELGFEGLDKEQVASELGGLAGGIGDVTASIVLMGGENETMQQMAASIEKAMAISMGMKGAIEGMAAANKLYTNLIKTGTLQTKLQTLATKAGAIAMKFFNAVLRANPIALLVTAIVAAGAALLIFAKNTSKASREAKMFSDIRKEAAKSIVNETTQLEILLEVAKDETVAKGKRQEAIEELNRISPEYLSNLSLENVNTAEGARLTDLYVESLIKASEAKAMKSKIDALSVEILEAESAEIGATEGMWAAATSTIFGNQAAVEGLVKGRQKSIQSIKDERQALLDKIIANTKEGEVAIGVAGQKSNAEIEAEKLAAEAEKARQKAWEDNAGKRAMDRDKEIQAKKNALMEDIEIRGKDLTMQTEELDRHSIHIEGLKTNEEILRDAKAIWHEEDLARIEEENAARRESAQIALDLALNTLGEISSVAGAYADRDVKAEEERFNKLRSTKQLTEKQLAAEELKSAQIKDAIRKKQFENEKKMQLATAAMNGAQALISILSQYPKFDGGFAMIAALAGSVITTAASIAKIKSTTFSSTPSAALPTLPSGESPDGAGAGGRGAQIDPVTNTSTILGDQQVTVVETDITNTQNNVSVIEESATF